MRRLPVRLRQRVRDRGARRARCRSAATRRSACPYGLYAEQLSGTAFTAPRADNRRSWLYRIRPSAMHRPFAPHRRRPHRQRLRRRSGDARTSCAGIRCRCRRRRPISSTAWSRWPATAAPPAQAGAAACTSMPPTARCSGRVFYDADGELLIVPQQGRLRFVTELGVIDVEPQEIAVIPRGVRFRVELPDGSGARLRLRELRRAASACPTSARSARTAWPTRATS